MRSLLQSVIVCTLSPSNKENQSKHSYSELADLLDIHKHKYRLIAISVASKRDALEHGGDKGIIFSQVTKIKGLIKINDDHLKKIHSFITNHLHVVESPLVTRAFSFRRLLKIAKFWVSMVPFHILMSNHI